MVLETKAKWQERTWMFMCVSVQELRVWNLRLGWTLRARCSSLQWKGSIVWRTRCQGGERSWAELWVSEEHGCFKRMWCPWPVSSVGNKKKKTAVLALRDLFRWRVHLGFLPHVPPLTPTAALYFLLQVAVFTHQRKKASPVCVSNGQRTLSMVPPHNNGVQVLRGKMCASLYFEHLILNKIFFVHTLAFIRWFLQLYYSNHVTGSLILCGITVS